jgi:tetratricopeptide (TPR) repeat protein
MPTTLDIFISSKMQELQAERQALFEFTKTLDYGDIKLHAWVFEKDAASSGRSIRDVYLNALQNAALYLGIVWNEYGEWTVDELEKATDWGIERHLYVKDVDAHRRDPRLTQLLERFGPVATGITAKWFATVEELKTAVRHSIEAWISHRLRARAAGASALLANGPDDLLQRPRKLIGREPILRDVRKLLAAGERVLLHGFGGMGKTALAATAAGEWLEGGKGSALWLKAGSSSEEVLLESLSRPIGAWQQIMSLEGDARNSTFRKSLRKSGVKLIVLDDCWNGRALFAVIASLPPDIPALVTSRQRFAVDHMLNIAELTLDESLALLTEHAKQDFSVEQAGPLCRKLSFHPFSLEVAGKALRAQGLAPDELLARIAEAPHDLQVPGDFSLKERSSVKDLLDASVSVLDAEARRVFFAFGAFFAPELTVEMLAQYLYSRVIWSDETMNFPGIVNASSKNVQSVRKALESLAIQGLAQRTSSESQSVHSMVLAAGQHGAGPQWREETELVEHYRIHDLSFSYVRAQTRDEERKKALDICLAFTFFHGEPGPATYRALRADRENLLGAATFALSQGRYWHVERFAINLFVVSGFFEAEGAYGDAVRLLEQAAEAAKRRADTNAHYRHLANLGKAHLNLGQSVRALQYNSEALRLARESKDDEVEQLMLMNIGAGHLQADELKQAYEYLTQAIAVANKRGDRRSAGMILGNLGILFDRIERLDDAYDVYKAAVEIGQEVKDDALIYKNLLNLGTLFHKEKQFEKAITVYRNGIPLIQQAGDRPAEAIAWHGLGFVYRDVGDAASAMEAWTMAQGLFAAMGDNVRAAACARLIAATGTHTE